MNRTTGVKILGRTWTGFALGLAVCAAGSTAIAQFGQPATAPGKLIGSRSGLHRRLPHRQQGDQDPLASAASEIDPVVLQALATEVDGQMLDVPLKDALAHLGHMARCTIVLDSQSLTDIGVPDDVLVSLSTRKLPLRYVLDHLLRPLSLTYLPSGNRLTVTTLENMESPKWHYVSVYPAADLAVQPGARSAKGSYDFDSLIELIQTVIAPEHWQDVGGAGTISSAQGAIVVSQSYAVQRRVQQLLSSLRRAARSQIARRSFQVLGLDEDHDTLRTQLEMECELAWEKLNTYQVAERVRSVTGVNVVVDAGGFYEMGLEPEEVKVSQYDARSTLADHLDEICRQMKIGWTVRSGAVVLSAPFAIESQLQVRLYPVAELAAAAGPFRHARTPDTDSLIQLITTHIAQDSWDDVGGPGSIQALQAPTVLVVSQTTPVHRQIETMLVELARASELEDQTVPSHLQAWLKAAAIDSAADSRVSAREPVAMVYPLPMQSSQEKLPAAELEQLIRELLGKRQLSRRGTAIQIVRDQVLVRLAPERHDELLELLRQYYPGYHTYHSGRPRGGFF